MSSRGMGDIFAYNSCFTCFGNRMKFAFIIFKYFPFGGAQRDMMRIARECMKLGHEVHIYTMSWEGADPAGGITVHVIGASGWMNHRRYQDFINQAREQIGAASFDLVVGFNRMPGLDAYFAADPCFAERNQNRSFFQRFSGRNRWFSSCEKAVFKADADCTVLLLSEREKSIFQRWYRTPDQRLYLVPPFLSRERMVLRDVAEMRAALRREFGFGGDDLVLLLVGSGFRTKGLDRVIEGLSALPQDLKRRTRLLAIGQDNPKMFARLANKTGLSHRVKILAGRDDIPQLMQGADLLVHPARRELAGHVLLEAMASGLPVLTTDVCGYGMHVERAGAGVVLASPFDQAQFNSRMAEMLVSPARTAWRDSGLRYASAIMAANDGGAEARMLESMATKKRNTGNAVAL